MKTKSQVQEKVTEIGKIDDYLDGLEVGLYEVSEHVKLLLYRLNKAREKLGKLNHELCEYLVKEAEEG